MPLAIDPDTWDNMTVAQRAVSINFFGAYRGLPRRPLLLRREVDMTSVVEDHAGSRLRMSPTMSPNSYAEQSTREAETVWDAMNIHVYSITKRNVDVLAGVSAVNEPMIVSNLTKEYRAMECRLRQSLYDIFAAGINLGEISMVINGEDGKLYYFERDKLIQSEYDLLETISNLTQPSFPILHELIDLADMLQTGP